VPRPHGFYDGVLLMDMVSDADGDVAPRLADVDMPVEQALAWHTMLLEQVVRMLCAGLVHGDLSEFNVLIAADGPVIIDLPQAVDAARNNHAAHMLERDVDNLARYFGQFAPQLVDTQYGKEIWALYAAGELQLDSALTGCVAADTKAPDVNAVLAEIASVRAEEELRRERAAAGVLES
jgi:RIO kinase 1